MATAHGNSFPDGTVIFVDPDQAAKIKPGSKVIARLDSGSATFRCYIEDSGQQFLKPLNPTYPLIAGGFTPIGKVIGAWVEEE